nr:hypothetical protein [Mycoplasmopsis bovis]
MQKIKIQETNSQSNSENQDSKPNSESNQKIKIQKQTHNLNAGNSRFRN